MMINAIPIIRPPRITYCRRRPHRDFVLSEINPIIGSVKQSNILGKK